jgi:hypothetical protein
MTGRAWWVLALCLAAGLVGCGERPEPMSVTSIVPVSAPSGATVIITGSGLGSTGKLETSKQVVLKTKSWSAKQIEFQVPEDLAPGDHELWVQGDTERAGPLPFKKLKAAPLLTSHDGGRVQVGQSVTVKGLHLGADRSKSQLTVANAPVTEIESWSTTAIKFKVPPPADKTSGTGLVAVVDGEASNDLMFEFAKPFAERVNPDPAPQGWTVEIKGRSFGAKAGTVEFGTAQATVVTWSDDTITAKLPANLTGDVRFRVSNENGASVPVQLSIIAPAPSGPITSAPPGRQLELVLDKYDFPHVFGFDPDKNVFAHSSWNGKEWVSETLKPYLGGGEAPRIVTPLEEKIRQLTDENARLPNRDPKVLEDKIKALVAKEQGLPTNAVKESVSQAGFFPRAAIDQNNVVHVVFHDLNSQKTVHGLRESEDFTFAYVRPQKGAADGLFASIAVDKKNRPVVAFMDNSGGRAFVATRENGEFKTEQADTQDKVGLAMSLAVDAKGEPHLAYLDFGNFDLRVASRAGQFKAETVDAEGWTGDTPSIVVDDKGTPHVAFLKRDAQGLIASEVRYAVREGGKWAVEVVEAGPGIGAQPALLVDGKGALRLFYVDTGKKQLRVCTREGKSWKKTSVALDAAMTIEPGQLRVALGTDGRPRILYNQGEPAKLRYRVLD